jgi:hypothetical protein
MLTLPMSRNEPGPPEYGYSGPLYGLTGETPRSMYEGPYYPQGPVSPWVRPVISVGYDYDPSQRPSVNPSPVPLYSVQTTNEPYPPGFRPQRSPGPMTVALPPSQGPADVQNHNRAGCTTIATTLGPFARMTFSHCYLADS